jgi:hypothetical protein
LLLVFLLLSLFNSFASFVLVWCGNACATCTTLLFFSPCSMLPLFSLCSTLLLFYFLFNFVIPISLLDATTFHSLVGVLTLAFFTLAFFTQRYCSYVPCSSPVWVAPTLVPLCYAMMLLLLCSLRLPIVGCSHFGTFLLCRDVVTPMLLVSALVSNLCSLCLLLFQIGTFPFSV